MATIKKRGSMWQVSIRLKGHDPIYASFTKKTLADDWAVSKEAEIKEGRYKDTRTASKVLMVDLFDKYQEHIAPTKEASSQSSIKARIGTLKRFCTKRNLTLGGTTVDDVLEYVDERLALGLLSDSIRKELQTWTDTIDSARLWKLHIIANPVVEAKRIIKKLRKLKPGNKRERTLLPGEYEKIRDCQHSHFTLINEVSLFAIETGMRESEIASARREYLDLERSILHVPKSKMDWLTGNKGKVVPLSPVAKNILEGLPVWFLDGTLFGMKAASIKRAFSRLRKKQRLKDLRFHDLCHVATTRLFESGFEIYEVSAITGKKDWRTLKRYTHPNPEKLAQKMSRIHQDASPPDDSQRTEGRAVLSLVYKSE